MLEEQQVETIDFLVVDVEGAERQVLESVDLTRFRPTVIVCEATLPGSSYDYANPSAIFTHQEWEHLLLKAGYVHVYFDSLNRFYLRSESGHLLSRFSFPVSPVRDYFQRVEDVRAVEHLGTQLEESRGDVEQLGAKLEELHEEAELLRAQLVDAETTSHVRIMELERACEGLKYAIWARDGAFRRTHSRRSPVQRALQRLGQDASATR
jgi:hypothetical protein